jgi:hypothetical protein
VQCANTNLSCINSAVCCLGNINFGFTKQNTLAANEPFSKTALKIKQTIIEW